MEMELLSGAMGAKTICGIWFVKELFSFLLKFNKQDGRLYGPNDEWRKYCTEKFETISGKLNEVYTAQEVMKVKLSHLEKSIKGARA